MNSDALVIQSCMEKNGGLNFLYTAREILYRLNEISFNSSLMREMSGINTLSRLIDRGEVTNKTFSSVKFHMIKTYE